MRNNVRIYLLLIAISIAIATNIASALEVAGVAVPETAIVSGQKLVLNGAGVRKKFVIKIYVGALYLPQKVTSADDAIGRPGPKRVTMSFLYKKVEAKSLTDGWDDGFRKNHTEAQMRTLEDRLARFNSFFTDVKRGDLITLDYVPGNGTQVDINGDVKGSVAGDDFSRALLKVWLGDRPADSGLKKAMLGN